MLEMRWLKAIINKSSYLRRMTFYLLKFGATENYRGFVLISNFNLPLI